MLCEYGCGREARYPPTKSTRRKWCCSPRVYMCPSMSHSLLRKSLYVKKIWSDPEYKKKRVERVNKKLWQDPDYREKVKKGVKRAWESKKTGLHSSARSEKLKKSNREAYEKNPQLRKIISERTREGIKRYFQENPEKLQELKRRQKEFMERGGASYLNSLIKNPSKPQMKIYEFVKELFPNFLVELNFPFLKYSLDVALPEQKIAIEYDGWYFHDGPRSSLQKDMEKQRICEKHGWSFLRYKGTRERDTIPTKEQLQKDIITLLRKKQKC